ncbi:MAG: EAL domain-containing protein [Betaproteobacteria bacterium]|nr:EAL domain-containing protein [Betaproteobacteria bacterium]
MRAPIPDALLAQALNAMSEASLITDAQQLVLHANAAFTEVTGYAAEEIVGHDCRLLQGPQTDPDTVRQIRQALEQGKTFRGEILNYRKNGSPFWNALTITPMLDASAQVTHFVSVQRDVTQQRMLRDQLHHQAWHDPLTGLPNRLGLSQHVGDAIARAKRSHTALAMGMIDLDDFKSVNDNWGHLAGDALLRELARRLQSRLRATDFLARLGGDELVIVLEGLDVGRTTDELTALAHRLHAAVESAFDVTPGQSAEVDMRMGVALYPSHGDEPDHLLRLADAALYQAKAHKHDGSRWWRAWGESEPLDAALSVHDSGLDPYGWQASALLEEIRLPLHKVVTQFVKRFYASMRQRSEPAAVLNQLSAQEHAHLQASQGEHLLQLLAPTVEEANHRRKALQLGRIHALVGLGSSEAVLAMQDYSSLLHGMVQALAWRVERRGALFGVINERLKREMQWELEGMNQVDQSRRSALALMEAQADAWTKAGDFIDSALSAIVQHPEGIQGVAYLEPSSEDGIVLRRSVGCSRAYFADLANAGVELTFHASNPSLNQTSAVSAWLSGEIVTRTNYALHPGLSAIQPIAQQHGIRSSASIPLSGKAGNPAAVLTLFGAYPNQFESWSAQLWLRSLQQIFQRHGAQVQGAPKIALSREDRERYRRLLHGDGLRMHMQPIVDLYTGRFVKVEALARLDDGGEIISPLRFLPACGEQDLAWLFRTGLAQALQWLRTWEEAGLLLDLSINLPPSVLIMHECPSWVQQALHAAQVVPQRLTLELLESEESADINRRDASVAELASLGVNLAMDDLGSGYSSLQRLQALPFHAVKIDQYPVRRAVESPEKSIPFLGALVRMAQGMGIRVAMEGLETPELVEMAAALGVDWGQGYAIARPMPPQNVVDWAAQWVWSLNPDKPQHAMGRRARAFSRESLSLDWKRAIEAHQRWRQDFESSMFEAGKPLEWQITCRDDKCHLGRWLYRHRKTCGVEQRPLFDRVVAEHARFHTMAGHLLRRVQEGEDRQSVMLALRHGALPEVSARLIGLLQELGGLVPDGAADAGGTAPHANLAAPLEARSLSTASS